MRGHLQPEFIKAAERRQVSAGEARPSGNVRHVEVFQMRRVGTFIFERPRPLSRQRRANHLYTLICEEPVNPHAARMFAVNQRRENDYLRNDESMAADGAAPNGQPQISPWTASPCAAWTSPRPSAAR